ARSGAGRVPRATPGGGGRSIQCSGAAPARQRRGDRPQVPLAHVRRLRRRPLLRSGARTGAAAGGGGDAPGRFHLRGPVERQAVLETAPVSTRPDRGAGRARRRAARQRVRVAVCDGKPEVRRRMVSAAARRHGLPIAMCNLVGGNDSLIFDGRSLLVRANGEVQREAAAFVEDLVVDELVPGVPRAGRERSRTSGESVISDQTAKTPAGALAVVAAYEADFSDEACRDLADALTLGI